MLKIIAEKLLVAAILLTAANSYAGENWTYVDRSPESSMNVTLQIKMASVESINANTVRALTRFVRTDENNRTFYTFPTTVDSVEMTIDFDCNKMRYKYLQETRITTTGYRVPIENKSVPTYDETSENSLWNSAREMVCKSEGKMKLR